MRQSIKTNSYKDLDIEVKLQKVEEMKRSLVSRQTMRESLSKNAWSKFVT